MKNERIKVNTVIVGTGASGYNTAVCLKKNGVDDILLISEDKDAGTSRNTGSDKQTYYKLTLSGGESDSVRAMAETLFNGKAVDGDIALAEAALSTQGFMHLCLLGLPFPVNRWGEYVGYKTDHDPRTRATSIGPYTSREMTRSLEKEAGSLGVPYRDRLQVIRILSDGRKTYGLIALDKDRNTYVTIEAENVVWATGGPSGIYSSSVYPVSQHGSTGLAFEAGVRGRNLTEWQFGLASVNPRWNVSGTYMQVLPRFISTEEDGSDEREFLSSFFSSPSDLLTSVFLKGYQWPFDVRKVNGGSSIIDILVYIEESKGRRVFLDFTKDPMEGNFSFDVLSKEAYDYLKKANALVKTPVGRLRIMNSPAIDFYHDKGVDIEKEPLEIALCAQHNNGGLDINAWWESNIGGFFVVGEAAGSHGIYRPGGSALNAGQVGSARAALYISERRDENAHTGEEFESVLNNCMEDVEDIASSTKGEESNVSSIMDNLQKKMSAAGGAIRNDVEMKALLEEIDTLLSSFTEKVRYSSPEELKDVYRLKDMLITQKCYLESMVNYITEGGKSRGSALYTDGGGTKPYPSLPDTFTFTLDSGEKDEYIQEMTYRGGKCSFSWRKVRPIPADDDFFENVWRGYRENRNVR